MYDPVKPPELFQLRRKFFVLYNGLLTQEPPVAPVGPRLCVGDENVLAIRLDVSSWFRLESNTPVEHFRFEIRAVTPPRDNSLRAGEVLAIGHNPVSLGAGVNWIRRLGPLIIQAIYMEDERPLLDEVAVTMLLNNLTDQFEGHFEEIKREAEAVRSFFESNRNWKPVGVVASPP